MWLTCRRSVHFAFQKIGLPWFNECIAYSVPIVIYNQIIVGATATMALSRNTDIVPVVLSSGMITHYQASVCMPWCFLLLYDTKMLSFEPSTPEITADWKIICPRAAREVVTSVPQRLRISARYWYGYGPGPSQATATNQQDVANIVRCVKTDNHQTQSTSQ